MRANFIRAAFGALVFCSLPAAAAQIHRFTLPKANSQIVLKADGGIQFNGTSVSLAQLRELLRHAKASNPSYTTRIAGEPGVPYATVDEVFKLAMELGVFNGLATRRVQH